MNIQSKLIQNLFTSFIAIVFTYGAWQQTSTARGRVTKAPRCSSKLRSPSHNRVRGNTHHTSRRTVGESKDRSSIRRAKNHPNYPQVNKFVYVIPHNVKITRATKKRVYVQKEWASSWQTQLPEMVYLANYHQTPVKMVNGKSPEIFPVIKPNANLAKLQLHMHLKTMRYYLRSFGRGGVSHPVHRQKPAKVEVAFLKVVHANQYRVKVQQLSNNPKAAVMEMLSMAKATAKDVVGQVDGKMVHIKPTMNLKDAERVFGRPI